MTYNQKLKSLFMSREQTIYLFVMFSNCIIFGMFASTFTYYQIGLGTRYYSAIVCLSCLVSVVHAFFSTDIKKKRWIFNHYKTIDLLESIFFTFTEMGFFVYYLLKGLNPNINEAPVLNLFFFWSIFYKIVNSVLSVVIPNIGDVFEQSLYSNQIDYQNHSNAENIAISLGTAIGSAGCWIFGDFFKNHPYFIFFLVFVDWIGLWSRWQFYFNPKNYSIIKKNFAKDIEEKLRKSSEK